MHSGSQSLDIPFEEYIFQQGKEVGSEFDQWVDAHSANETELRRLTIRCRRWNTPDSDLTEISVVTDKTRGESFSAPCASIPRGHC
ncbi:MAG: hypothetical protein ACI841_001278 [Planctomycetota bacterium]|jgi:hypothetical protein